MMPLPLRTVAGSDGRMHSLSYSTAAQIKPRLDKDKP